MKKFVLLIFILALINPIFSQSKSKLKSKITLIKDSLNKVALFPEKNTFQIDTTTSIKQNFKLYKTNAHASYYSDKLNGKRTASGKRFDNSKLTAANKKFPFGTLLRVTNEANGKSVIVEVIDRGPFVKGREIDLTKKAFMQIVGSQYGGSIKVKIEVLQK